MPQTPVVRGWQRTEPLPLSGSERRLFRLYRRDANGSKLSAILVDASMEATTSAVAPYLQRLQELTFFLTKVGLCVPRIEAVDRARSVAVVEDLGANSYARCLTLRGVEACTPLFEQALDGLIRLSKIDLAQAPVTLPAFTEERFVEQTTPFVDAFLAPKQLWAWQELWRNIYRAAAFGKHEIAPVLGDVHIENMFARQGELRERCVFIDFQDAHAAPRCYDVVSLLEDSLWSMPPTLREKLWNCYKKAYAGRDTASAARHYALCALHREVCLIGILYRLKHCRNKERYGAWLATTVSRCKQHLAEHACFADLRQFLECNLDFGAEDFGTGKHL